MKKLRNSPRIRYGKIALYLLYVAEFPPLPLAISRRKNAE